MCGIFAYLSNIGLTPERVEALVRESKKIVHRGPDYTAHRIVNDNLFFSFHRLAINGLDSESNQPFDFEDVVLICNGEIYNYKDLVEEHGFDYCTHSDCEVIVHMYKRFGIEETVKRLDGVFAFVLYDKLLDAIYVARDHLGVRPLYIGTDDRGTDICFASELKALSFMDEYIQFPPRTWWCSNDPATFNPYYQLYYPRGVASLSRKDLTDRLREVFERAVEKRFVMADVEVGCLLSGGLDSSLVASICSRLADSPNDLKTFSIGLEGSPDLIAAQKVADFLGTDHYSVKCSEADFLGAIRDTIYTLGTFDITTIRASVGHRLISLWVRDNTDVKVLFSGENADEASGSYAYFAKAPSPEDFQEESVRLLSEIHLFDNLRSDRSISCAGIESRVPFTDKDFMNFYMAIAPELKMFGNGEMEKKLLREAFSDGYLPEEVLNRAKNGFSDSVSHIGRSWSVIIQEMIEKELSDEEFEIGKMEYPEDIRPKLKEGYYYLKIYEEFYGDNHRNHRNICPHQWLPRWCGNVADPSARVLNVYKAD